MTVVWALTWLGQSAALGALTAALVRLPAFGRSAAARHAAWAAALVLCAGLLAWPLQPASTAVPAQVFAPSIPLLVLPAPVIRVSWWLGWLWSLGTAAGLALAARDVWRVVRLKRRTVPLTAAERALLCAGLPARTSSRAPRLAWCDELGSPAVLGFFRPVIALPHSQVPSLPEAQLPLVVLHELAHVRRGDDWRALAERIILALTWVNPVVHLMQRELSLSREMACDEWVVRQTAAPLAYAKCLAEVAGLQTRGRRVRLAAGVMGRPGTLRRRIVGVLALDGRPAARAASVVAWLAPVAVCGVAAGLLHLPPVFAVAYTPDSAARAPASYGLVEASARVSLERPAAQPETVIGPPAVRRASVPRRSSEVMELTAGPAVPGEVPLPIAAELDMAVPQAEAADRQPLAARTLPGAGSPGVTAAAVVPAAITFPSSPARWWSGPASIANSTGAAAATAGRATASFVTRFGSHVPQLLKR